MCMYLKQLSGPGHAKPPPTPPRQTTSGHFHGCFMSVRSEMCEKPLKLSVKWGIITRPLRKLVGSHSELHNKYGNSTDKIFFISYNDTGTHRRSHGRWGRRNVKCCVPSLRMFLTAFCVANYCNWLTKWAHKQQLITCSCLSSVSHHLSATVDSFKSADAIMLNEQLTTFCFCAVMSQLTADGGVTLFRQLNVRSAHMLIQIFDTRSGSSEF